LRTYKFTIEKITKILQNKAKFWRLNRLSGTARAVNRARVCLQGMRHELWHRGKAGAAFCKGPPPKRRLADPGTAGTIRSD